MKIKDYLILAGALVSLVLAFLYHKARIRLGDLEADKVSREQRVRIDIKKAEAKDAKFNYEEALDRFNDLLKRYKSK